MKIVTVRMWMVIALLLVQFASVQAQQCSDREYATFKRYDAYLDANPSMDDNKARANFAAQVGMKPAALKDLYHRCLSRWKDQEPVAVQKAGRDALAAMAVGGESPLTMGHSCNTLGFRYGHTGTSTMLRKQPQPGWDFVMPERCRNKPDTDAGVMAGTKAAAR